MCTMYVPGDHVDQTRALDSLELVVSHYMGTRNRTWVLCKSVKYT